MRVTREYELMYIVRPEVDDDGLTETIGSVRTLVEGVGGTVLKTTMWGKRRLAYEVKHLRDGYYVIVRANLDTDKVKELSRSLAIHGNVFRHLVTVAPDITDPSQVQDEPVTAEVEQPAVASDEDEDEDDDYGEDDEDADIEPEYASAGAQEGN